MTASAPAKSAAGLRITPHHRNIGPEDIMMYSALTLSLMLGGANGLVVGTPATRLTIPKIAMQANCMHRSQTNEPG